MVLTSFQLKQILEPKQLQDIVTQAGKAVGWRAVRTEERFRAYSTVDPSLSVKVTEAGLDLCGKYFRAVRVTNIYGPPTDTITIHSGWAEFAFASTREIREFQHKLGHYADLIRHFIPFID